MYDIIIWNIFNLNMCTCMGLVRVVSGTKERNNTSLSSIDVVKATETPEIDCKKMAMG
jgi:hypothetical protein